MKPTTPRRPVQYKLTPHLDRLIRGRMLIDLELMRKLCVTVEVLANGYEHYHNCGWLKGHAWWYLSDFSGHIDYLNLLQLELYDLVCLPMQSSNIYSPHGAVVAIPPLCNTGV